MYCSDAAKLIQSPVLHVNGDDPEALAFAAELAADYLREFQKDIFIDIVCYRRLGHNEADEPAATQPMMYQKIRKHAVPAQVYAERLVAEGVIAAGDYEKLQDDYRQRLEAGDSVARPQPPRPNARLENEWKAFSKPDIHAPVENRLSGQGPHPSRRQNLHPARRFHAAPHRGKNASDARGNVCRQATAGLGHG